MAEDSQNRDVEGIIEEMKGLPGALLPMLHAIQEAEGYIDPQRVPAIASALNLSRAEVHGVISFYHHFHSQPTGRHVVQVCRAEACQAVGARALENHISEKLDLSMGETSADGQITLEPVYCLGNCACGPSVQIGAEVHARVSPARFDELLATKLQDSAEAKQ